MSDFERLANQYRGDVPVTTILKEMKRVGVVVTVVPETCEEDEGPEEEHLCVLQRYYMPQLSDMSALERSGFVAEDLGDTLFFNLYRDHSEESRYEGRASNHSIDRRCIPEFREFVEREADQYLVKVDDWLSQHEIDSNDRKSVRLGMGTYWIEEKPKR